MNEDSGGLLSILIILAIAGIVIYFTIVVAAFLASIAGIGGIAWGGGTAIVNYGKSFKENMIDSNRAAA